jgi:drug/metabolite transporter (DMT)-like permease
MTESDSSIDLSLAVSPASSMDAPSAPDVGDGAVALADKTRFDAPKTDGTSEPTPDQMALESAAQGNSQFQPSPLMSERHVTSEGPLVRTGDQGSSTLIHRVVRQEQSHAIPRSTTPASVQPMTWLDWLLLLVLSILWGGSSLLGKIIVGSVPPFTTVAVRVMLAALTLSLVLPLMGLAVPRGRAVWGTLLGMGLLNNAIPFSLIIWGQTQIGAGLASIINAMTPLFTVLVAHVLTKDERLNASKLAGVGFGLVGVVVLINPQGGTSHPFAVIACLGATLSYGFANIWGRRFRRFDIQPVQMAFGQVVMSSLVMLPLALLVDHPWTLPMPSVQVVGSLLVFGIVCTALAYILFFRVLSRAGATAASLVTFLIPPSAIAMGALVLGESLSLMQYGGMALIGIGLAAVDGRPSKWLMSRAG